MRNRTRPQGPSFLADHDSLRAEGCGSSSCAHTHDDPSVARAIRGSLRSRESLSYGLANHGFLAMNLRSEPRRKGCADASGTQVWLSCFGIALILVLAIWGEWIAAAAVEAVR